MEFSTIGTIYALKHALKEYDETVAEWWSKYTETPVKHYSEEKLTQIAKNVFIDYIKSAKNPSFEVWNLFECMRFNYRLLSPSSEEFDKRVRNGIWAALVSTTVRCNGEYTNGFRDIEEELKKYGIE